ncbi:hypothetical protein E9549_13115 [Blastococcus sp. MG754426]|uniref:hypothetical protein n=1 Tax=unclassified Blastococcus TaxID=2619396 RepID=UPI001EF02E64|nr:MULTISPECIES: hypothetical protein [unclassified Blastococcus]MCF6508338.1 hypothetical protein [Blastococcus sp. MG754426]MCF6513046.1 hypothetical protein [Blastococcus sp. MG754427]MCF6734091.1 hypothetical protein [Blastococcus sp. KM273129]
MTSGHVGPAEAAHAAAASAIQELYDEALRHLDAVARSLEAAGPAAQEAGEPPKPRTDAVHPTLELPRRLLSPVADAA